MTDVAVAGTWIERRGGVLWRALPGIGVVAVCYVLAEFAEGAGVPAAQLLVALVIGAALALGGWIRRPLLVQIVRPSHAVVGALMGSYLQVGALGSVAAEAAPLLVVTLATVGVCFGVAQLLSRITAIPLPDSALGMTPGGSAAIVACAGEIGADARFVAFAQYIRVGMVALTAPFVVLLAQPAAAGAGLVMAGFPTPGHLVDADGEVAGLMVLTAICLLGAQLGRRLSLPAPVLLGSMLVAAVASASDGVNGFTPAGPLRDAVFVVIGLEVGLKFTRAAIRHIGRTLPLVFGSTVLVCAICAGLAALLPLTTGIPFLEAYLATTPGGINAVLATADSAQVNVPVVTAVQSLRLFLVCLLVPLLARRFSAPKPDRDLVREAS